MSQAFCLDAMSKQVYENTTGYIYDVMHHFYLVNNPKAVKAAYDFYVRCRLSVPDANDVIDVEISLDGAISVKGHESTYCISFAMEVWTNRSLDKELSIKCFICKDAHLISTNGTCPHGFFHGPTGSMEAFNARKIFQRSVEKNRMRYTRYVADGDCKIFRDIQALKPYGEIIIQKKECTNHVSKRSFRLLKAFSETWTLAVAAQREAAYLERVNKYENCGKKS